jgi:hypothetical protein
MTDQRAAETRPARKPKFSSKWVREFPPTIEKRPRVTFAPGVSTETCPVVGPVLVVCSIFPAKSIFS